MTATGYTSYEEAASEYLNQFRALRDTPGDQTLAVTRGAGNIPAETLVQRAGEIAGVSASMIPLAKTFLEAPDPALREGISGQLLAQAAAELQIATELLHIAVDEGVDTAGEPAGPHGVTRDARGTHLQDSINHLEEMMSAPVSAGLVSPNTIRLRAAAASTPDEAKKELIRAVTITSSNISDRVVEIGGALAFNLVANTEWASVIQSAALVNKQVAGLVDCVKKGASNLAQKAATNATLTIMNVYDKILALVGKPVEDEARKQIQIWLEKIKSEGNIEIFEQLIAKLYQVDQLKKNLPGWLGKTAADLDKLNATTSSVDALLQKFSVLLGQVNSIGSVIGLVRSPIILASFPQVVVIAAGVQVALLVVLVYAGYDYIGYGQTKFLNITKGVAEVIRENLTV